PDRGGPGDEALPRGDADRQLPPGARADRRRRLRLRDEDRVLRQVRPDRTRRDGTGPCPDPRPDRGRDRRLTEPDLEQAALRTVEAATSAGASEAEAWAEGSRSREVRVHGGEVESLTEASGRGVGVRAWIGARTGYAYGTDLSDSGIAEL